MLVTPITKTRELYADFRKDLLSNPVNFDLARKTNEEAVKESILNLVLTNRGERFFQPNLGCDVKHMLFEHISDFNSITIEEMIKETIEKYEPRANVIGVKAYSDQPGNAVKLSITFNTSNSEDDIVLTTTLTRVR